MSPLWVDALIVFTLLEATLLATWHRRRGRGVALAEFGPNLLSGLCLMGALRAALAGWHPLVILSLISVSGLAHAWDLRRRWR